MGHQITKKSTPRRGSLQYYPIKKSKRAFNNITNFGNLAPKELSGFAGYKVGMLQVSYIDSDKNSPTFKNDILTNATLLECPPMVVSALKFYNNGKTIGETWAQGLNKNITRTVKYKENNSSSDDLKAKSDDLRLLVSTQPWLIGLKKKPELFELGVGGSIDDKYSVAKDLLGKELDVSSVIKDGYFVDVSAVTKGKGFTGSVKRFGVKIFPQHASKSRRKAGNLGAESMAKVQFTVPQHGRLGFNSRVEYNKFVLKIVKTPDDVNIKKGYTRYGNVSGTVLVLKGSVPGSTGRLIILRKAIRQIKKLEPVKVNFIR
ncbi:MAG: 50S ribosomal protein L3 [Candidatus Parvarchaeota archaeon]|nr:50S ribosomal protein L3 [Candidatus Parvarchaeota archaeon]